MKRWIMDKHTPTRGLIFEASESLYTESSQYQTIEIVKTEDFGTVMLLDGVLMVTQRDEYVYHEMLSHPTLFTNPNPQNVLIIGGGDCGTLTQVLRHKSVQKVIQVEIDEMVTRVSRQYFPQLTKCISDPRAELVFADGIRYLQENQDSFDVILVDSTDPVGPAEGLFRKEFFADCQRALKADGILTIQSESPWIDDLQIVISQVNQDLQELFTHVKPYLASIQTYQAGLWMFQMASKKYQPCLDDQKKAISESSMEFSYFNQDVFSGCFILPEFVRKLIK